MTFAWNFFPDFSDFIEGGLWDKSFIGNNYKVFRGSNSSCSRAYTLPSSLRKVRPSADGPALPAVR